MDFMEMFESVDMFVSKTADRAGLPALRSTGGVFDGDAWRWEWYSLELMNAKEMQIVSMTARPDAFGEGLTLTVSALAMLVQNRSISDARVYYARYVDMIDFGRREAELSGECARELARAWREVRVMAQHLPELNRQRAALRDELRRAKLFI